MSKSADARVSPVFKAMNRPLTVLGAERRLFFVALISGGAIFSLLHSFLAESASSSSASSSPAHRDQARRGDSARALQLRQVPQTV